MVNIGSDSSGAPTAGNNIYIGPGAKIFGGITLKDKVAIGANAVVNKSFDESNITIAGVPAKIVSRNSERVQIVEAVSLAKKYLGEK